MSKLRKVVKVAVALGAVAGAARYLSNETNRSTLYYRAAAVGQTVANVAGAVTDKAVQAKDRVAARVG